MGKWSPLTASPTPLVRIWCFKDSVLPQYNIIDLFHLDKLTVCVLSNVSLILWFQVFIFVLFLSVSKQLQSLCVGEA